MPFPVADRVLYKKNPLEVVVCQLRFPTILRIDAELPVAFQERIKERFPDFAESTEIQLEIQNPGGEKISSEIVRQVIQSNAPKNYEFTAGDGNWKVNLTRTFLALSTKHYTKWDDFSVLFNQVIQALVDIYQPSYFSRVGLRYVNKIKRSALNLDGVEWRELLSANLIGLLNSTDTAGSVEALETIQGITLAEDGGNARIVSKLSQEGSPPEQIFTIDGDFFHKTRIETASVMDKLNFLNLRSSRFIRWAVLTRLHEAMEPEVI